jgi:uncharacterized protein YidB (DUF937 family)
MGLLDQMLGALPGTSGGSSSLPNALMSLLGGNQGGSAIGMSSGLQALVSRFQAAGLGHIAQSWVGSGPNQPVTPNQLHTALGDEQVQSMASQSGLAPHDLLSQLSQHLPGLIDRLTPNGRLPEGDGPVNV